MPDRNWCIAVAFVTAAAAMTVVTASETVVSEPNFGINRGALAFNDECNDPRFVTRDGPDKADPAQIFGDAADCYAAWNKGGIILREVSHYRVTEMATMAHLTENFGDLDRERGDTDDAGDTLGSDQGPWSLNGACNDPRFAADPRWLDAVDWIGNAEGRDATDCLWAFFLRQAWPIKVWLNDNEGIAFGDDSGEWANDGECDDPRFVGIAAAGSASASDLLRDAADCYTAWRNDEIALFAPDLVQNKLPEGFNLGDDRGEWAFDSECDDPRFEGVGMAYQFQTDDQARDATDCGKALLIDEVALKIPRLRDGTELSFGDDGGEWANDGVCNDPRFAADPRWPDAVAPVGDAERLDITDCEQGFFKRRVWPTWSRLNDDAAIAFGDDSGEWTNDGECDDSRFIGIAASESANALNLLRDATDCYAAWMNEEIALFSPYLLHGRLPDGFDLGNDTSEWAFDGECDDPRFEGVSMARELRDGDHARDATDCGKVLLNDEVELKVPRLQDGTELSFGDDGGEWANDGVCNDPRFEADPRWPDAVAHTGDAEDLDSTDCEIGFLERRVWPIWSRPNDDEGIAFGGDSGEWTNDGECDDPRFFGIAAAVSASASEILSDATDCYAAWTAQTIKLFSLDPVRGRLPDGFDLGDDTSEWAFDGECDDPRFHGDGVALELRVQDQGGDATDCGRAFLKGSAAIRTEALD